MKKVVFILLILLLGGCSAPPAEETPGPSPTLEPAAESTLSPVWSDWSRLAPYEPLEPVYTRQREEFMDYLVPAKDYGPLLPFEGVELSFRSPYEEDESHETYTRYLFGLVTRRGKVVLDPVLISVEDPYYSDEDPFHGLIYLLQRPDASCAVCAQDGSWCTDFVYEFDNDPIVFLDRSQGLLLLKNDTQLVSMDPKTGKETLIADQNALSQDPEEARAFFWEITSAYFQPQERFIAFYTFEWVGNDRLDQCYIYDTRTYTLTRQEGLLHLGGSFHQGLCPAQALDGGWGYIDGAGQWIIAPDYAWAGDFRKGRALVEDQEGRYLFLDKESNVLYTVPAGYSAGEYSDEYTEFYRDTDSIWLDENFIPLDIPVVGRAERLWNGGFYWEEGDQGVFWLDGKRYGLPVAAEIEDREDHYVLQCTGSWSGGPFVLTNLDTGVSHTFSEVSHLRLEKQADGQVTLSGYQGGAWYDWYPNGNPYTPPEEEEEAEETGDGLVDDQTGNYFVLHDNKGQVVFRWPLVSGED